MTLRAAIYARQSLDRSGEALAVSRQLVETRALVERNGWTVTQEYVDNDVSATNGKARPEWSRLLADLDSGRLDVLVCWHTDRLYRRVRDLVDLVEIAERQALRIASVRAADLDLSTPAGRMLAGMLGHAQRYEMEQKGARQVAANRQRATAGHVGWTRRPYGYDQRSGQVVVVPAEAEVLRAAARRVLAGESLAGIARDLDSRGITTSTGGRWSVNALKRLLTSPRHAGRAVYKGEDVGPGAWDPILGPDTHERLVALLTDPGRRTTNSTAAKHLLSGITRCGRCGRPMYATPYGTGSLRYLVYRCHETHLTRRLDLVDEVVVAATLARLARPDVLRLLSPSEDVSALADESRSIRERLDGLGPLYADGALTAAGLREASSKLRGRLDDLQRRIAAATGGEHVAALVSATDVSAGWETMPVRQRRAIVNALMTVTILPAGKGVRFDPEQVRIEWRTS